MTNEEMVEKAVAHVVKMLDGTDGKRWNGLHPMYEGVCGWCGVMAPMNRPAFVAKFGEEFTKMVEDRARETLAARADFWGKSKGRQYEVEANTFEGVGDPGFLSVGSFVWGVMNGFKCDHENLRVSIRDLVRHKDEGRPEAPRLCRVIRIEEVEDIERDAATLLKGWKPQENEGGSNSDDVTEEEFGKYGERYSQLTDEQKRTFYTLAVLVRDAKGVYFLIDPEGYDYPRYVILPKSWEAKFSKTVGEIREEIKAEREAEEQAKAAKKAAARAAYEARCAKWEGIMEAVPSNIDTYDAEFRKVGKRNVARMAKACFPWVRFSVSYDGSWGTGYVLKWKNGPTVEEVKQAGDYALFMPWWDTFDGMTDCADTEYAQFHDFSDKFGGVGNGVEFEREECEKDQNGDPNGKPTKPPKPRKGNGGGSAEVRENKEKGGLEIYFPSMPSEEVRTMLKKCGWRFSRWNVCWYNRATDENRAFAASVVAKFNNKRAVA